MPPTRNNGLPCPPWRDIVVILSYFVRHIAMKTTKTKKVKIINEKTMIAWIWGNFSISWGICQAIRHNKVYIKSGSMGMSFFAPCP